VQGLDFNNVASKDVINGWIEEKTNHKIKNMIEGIDPDQVLFLVNAIYFKGDWTYEFDKSKTELATFYKESGSTTQVDMMFSKGVKLSYYANNRISLIDIPYGNGQYQFTVLMPALNSKTTDLLDSLNIESLKTWIAEADTATVELEMPKFKMEWNKKLNSELSSLGMAKAFSDGAELPYLFKKNLPLKVGFVQHKSFLEVNEEGSEAAAATVVGVVVTCACGNQTNRIRIDHPFIFFIREKHSGTILFAGQLSDPDLL
jgi:serpin B